MSIASTRVSRPVALLLVGTAVPVAYALETGLRVLLLPPDVEALRQELRPILTGFAWWLFGLAFPMALLGLWVKRRLFRRALVRLPEPTPALRERAEMEAFLLASSVPQIPALFCTVTSLAGASPEPVLATMAVATAGVLTQGLWRPGV